MFVDSASRIDREGLRTYVLAQLTTFKNQIERITIEKSSFFEKVRIAASKTLSPEESQRVKNVVDQLVELPNYLETWIETAVDTPERFEFFVLTKANEMHSNDQQKDYFWALQVRHDQLVALVRVMELLIDKIKLWTSIRPDQVLDDPIFAGLTEHGVEDQVYLEAQKVYEERKRMT